MHNGYCMDKDGLTGSESCKWGICHQNTSPSPPQPNCLSPYNLMCAYPRSYDEVRRKSLLRLEYDGIKLEGSAEEVAFAAMEKYAYYPCSKCGKAYFGGAAACDAAVADAAFDPDDLVCGACSGGECGSFG